MANLSSLSITSEPAEPEVVIAPEIVEGSRPGTVVVDPTKIVAPDPAKEDDLSKMERVDLEKSYRELRAKMSAEGAPKSTEKADDKVPTGAEVEKTVVAAGLDMAKLEAEYAESGAISEESLKALESKGLTRDQVARYVKGQEALASQFRTEFETLAGGPQEFKAVIEWAKSNVPVKELAPYNDALKTGNLDAAKLLMQGMVAAYTKANGKEPGLIVAATVPRSGAGVQAFASTAEITRAMGDARYKSGDAAYIQSVQDRMTLTDMSKLR